MLLLQPCQVQGRTGTTQVIEDRNLFAAGEEGVGQVAADEPSTAGDQMVHRVTSG